jgi:gamma-glutamyltranspeptidase/glutathione hydrolase
VQKEGLGDGLPLFHPYTITVPGACSAWCDLVERFGRLPMADVLAPARRLAEEGFPVAPITAFYWARGVERQLAQSLNGCELTLDGRAPRPGEIFHNLGLARAFDQIASGGKRAFYEGPIAESISAVVQEAGGCLMQSDLSAHRSTWEEPIHVNYRDLTIWECAPNGQGLAALLALNILNGFNLADLPPLSVERLHLEIEAMRLAFADAYYYVADPAFNPAPLEELLSPEYASARRKLIDPRQVNTHLEHGIPLAKSDTVYFTTADREGNACSFINSNYMGFGTGIVPRGWGFSLQNRALGFSLKSGHPNVLEPGKRPYHTIIPAMATRRADGGLFASFGVMGGFMQPQGHLQVAVGLTDDGLDPQAALDRPRFSVTERLETGEVALEEGIPVGVMAGLADLGHHVRPVSGMSRSMFGRGQVIYRDAETGVLWGGSDPRADGCAMSLE